ncbi:hypothetical protein NM688_g1208 [Phlebia brevispora]|uniref:Uncharacterized protein n=1 Tax=Phlebia brevispora TaxID=194682 RepID=A0ACC1TCE2_9APHY|nr:hypothetical protein NM688_g1208 [Phlebia brevispora]
MTTPLANPVIVAAYTADLTVNYCTYAALALAAYEHIITLQNECEFLLRRRWTAATWLLIANRYTLLGNLIAQSVPYSAQVPFYAFGCQRHHLLGRCYNSILQNFLDVFFKVLLVTSALFSALRVFALLDRAYFAAGCVLVLGLAQVGISLASAYISINKSHFHFVSTICLVQAAFRRSCLPHPCYSTVREIGGFMTRELTHLQVDLSGALASIASDVASIAMTWIKTHRHVKQAASVGIRSNFGATLLQYGTLYFVTLCVVNILPLVIFSNVSVTGWASGISVLINMLPNILISRFLINLRRVESPAHSDTSRFSHFSAPRFRVPTLPEIIGKLGECLSSDAEPDMLGNDGHDKGTPVKKDNSSIEEVPIDMA